MFFLEAEGNFVNIDDIAAIIDIDYANIEKEIDTDVRAIIYLKSGRLVYYFDQSYDTLVSTIKALISSKKKNKGDV